MTVCMNIYCEMSNPLKRHCLNRVMLSLFSHIDPMLTSSDADLMGSCSDVEGEKVSTGEVGVEVEDVEREVDSPAS